MVAGKLTRFTRRPLNTTQRRAVRKIANTQIQRAGEMKIHDVIAETTVGTAGFIEPLAGIIQGTNNSQRVGNMISLRKIQFSLNAVAGDNTNLFRHIIFLWHDAVAPTVAEVLEGGLTKPYAPYDYNNRKKYSIIHDRVLKMEGLGGDSQQFYRKTLKINRKALFAGTTATSYGAKNNLFSLVVSDSSAGPDVTYNIFYRLSYTDL